MYEHDDLLSRLSSATSLHRRRLPFGYHLDTIKRLEDAGCAAVVLHSLFEEQITLATKGRIRHRDPLDQDLQRAWLTSPLLTSTHWGRRSMRHTSVT